MGKYGRFCYSKQREVLFSFTSLPIVASAAAYKAVVFLKMRLKGTYFNDFVFLPGDLNGNASILIITRG